jgi:hypothetical protein
MADGNRQWDVIDEKSRVGHDRIRELGIANAEPPDLSEKLDL